MSNLKKTGITYWIHIAIFFILTFGIGMLPPFAQITEYGMDILGINTYFQQILQAVIIFVAVYIDVRVNGKKK